MNTFCPKNPYILWLGAFCESHYGEIIGSPSLKSLFHFCSLHRIYVTFYFKADKFNCNTLFFTLVFWLKRQIGHMLRNELQQGKCDKNLCQLVFKTGQRDEVIWCEPSLQVTPKPGAMTKERKSYFPVFVDTLSMFSL